MNDPSSPERTASDEGKLPDPGELWEALSGVADPELERDIVDLGLVYDIEEKEGAVTVRMTLTSPGCPYGPYLLQQVRLAAERVRGVKKVDIDLVWEPPWGPELMSEEARLDLGFDV